ncbi:hypothetical protein N8580_00590 [Akkermansiaceae bacterium]|nr:hypothetical protein [Akkermansiaceae bacterium]
MIIGIQPPGPWQYYVTRKDNIGLPVNEVRRKYLTEQLAFDNFQTQQLNMLQGRAGGAREAEVISEVTFASNLYLKHTVTSKSTIVNQVTFEVSGEGELYGGRRYYQSTTRTTSGEGSGLVDTTKTVRWNGNNWEIHSNSIPEGDNNGVMNSNTDITGEIPYIEGSTDGTSWTITHLAGLLDDDNVMELRETSWYA